MFIYTHRSAQKLRLLSGGLIVGICLFMLSVILSAVSTFSASASAQSQDARAAVIISSQSDPNVVAGGMAEAIQTLGYSAAAFGTALQDSFVSTAQSIGDSIGSSAAALGHAAYSGAALTAHAAGFYVHATGQAISFGVHGVVGIFGFMGQTAGNTVSGVARLMRVDSVIRPAYDTDIPIIDPDSPELAAALAAMPAQGPTAQPAGSSAPQIAANAGPAWPIHGNVTTLFGVPHWPYQPTHTGIDISDGKAPGITPVKAFRAGTVVNVIHSNRGLGNHVIVDHGSGVTSVYAHLHSTNVQTGQQVDTGTILGYEGSTGASTGTHLHFEIRVNGQAADPRQFVSGQP